MERDWDCVIVGGGAAGLAAALVLGRARRRALVVDAGRQSNLPAEHVGGLLAQEGTSPSELYARAREQLAGYPTVAFERGEVTAARRDDGGFLVTLDGDGGQLRARTLLLATGMDYEVPAVPGFRDHWGGAVFHCPFCHGWEVRDRRLVVCGSGEAAEMQVQLLQGWTDDVTLVDPAEVAGVHDDAGAFRGLLRHDGSVIACDAVLVHAPLRRRGDLAEQLGLELKDNGLIAIDGLARASAPGVFAAGDCAVAPQQVAIAIGSGHLAGAMVVRELLLEPA